MDTLTKTRSWHRQPVRQGIVPDHKLADFYRALKHPTIKDYLLLVLLTGLRRMEAMTLRWSDVDLESRTLTIPATRSKNHLEHRLPIGTFLLDLLAKRKASSSSDYVFPGKTGTHLTQISYMTAAVGRLAGLEFSVHDCRRTFLTMAERLGVPYRLLKKFTNHSQQNDVTLGYLVVDVERLREPMERVNQCFLDLMLKEASLLEELEAYLVCRPVSPKTEKDYRTILERSAADWLSKPLKDISVDMVKQRQAELSGSKGDMLVSVLRLLMRSKGMEAPQVQYVPRRSRNRKYIPDRKLAHWYQAVMVMRSTNIRDFLLLLLFTGIRRTEAAALKWNQVDLATGTMTLGEREVPLCSFLQELLSKRDRQPDYVFPGRRAGLVQIHQATGKVMEQIGISFTVHDLRRTFNRKARQLGFSSQHLTKQQIETVSIGLRNRMNADAS